MRKEEWGRKTAGEWRSRKNEGGWGGGQRREKKGEEN